MKIKLLFCLLLVFSCSISVSLGQKAGKKIIVSGFVKDGTDSPVANAVILVDGKNTKYLTDSKGFYKVKISSGSTTIGILTQTSGKLEEPINGREKIDFRFEGSIPVQVTGGTEQGDEAVDMGVKTVKKRSLTTPVDVIDAAEFLSGPE